MDWRHDLEHGSLHRFEDWPVESVPREPGVYTIWEQDHFIYVGIAKSGIEKGKGLRGRLESHARGKRGNDQFNVYVADRFVLPQLEPSEITAIANGTLSFDRRIKNYIREHLGFRFHVCTSAADASDIEKKIKGGKWPPRKPLLNPGRK